MFGGIRQTVDADGEPVRVASVLRRGAAVAVDLSLTVGVASLAFYLISTMAPLDAAVSKPWLTAVMFIALLYLVWGRDRLRSPGREIFRLRLVRLPGSLPGLRGRKLSVHAEDEPRDDSSQTRRAVAVVALATALSGFSLASTLGSTHVFQTALRHTERFQPLASEHGAPPVLNPLPRALLIGRQRAYVQVGARWGDRLGVLEFFLLRQRGDLWSVEAVRETPPSMFANYSLGAADQDVPAPTDRPE